MLQLDLFGALDKTSESSDKKKVKQPALSAAQTDENKEEATADFIIDQYSVLDKEPPAKKDETFFLENPPQELIKENKKKKEINYKNAESKVEIKKKVAVKNILPEKKEIEIKVTEKRGRKSFKQINAEVDYIEIPADELLFQKRYYTISEVAKWFKVNASLLRYWENEFDILKPHKNRKGDRLFRPEDVKNLQLIYHLLRQKKYTMEGAKDFLKSNKKNADTQLQLIITLKNFRKFLLDLKASL